jgi:hypothetical protein
MNAHNFENEVNASFDSLQPTVNQLVDRKKQISQFTSSLDKLGRRKPLSTPILQWHGAPGIGKSSLVRLLIGECKNLSVPYSLIDFSTLGDLNLYYEDPTLLIEKIVFDGWKATENEGRSLKEAIQKFRDAAKPEGQQFVVVYDRHPQQKISIVPKWLEELESLRIEFEKLAKSKSGAGDSSEEGNKQIRPLVVFLDETEIVKKELVYWIEDYILRPLSLLMVSLVVWMGRKPWQWRRPEVRQRMFSEKLDVFDGLEVEAHLKTQLAGEDESEELAKQLFQNVYGVTGGHPYADGVVINQINAWTAKKILITPDGLAQKQSDLFDRIFNEFIEDYAFKHLPAEQKTACELLSMVRRFDVKMLQEITKTLDSPLFRTWEREQFRDLLNELKKAQFMDWNQGFVIDQSLRHLISEYYFWRRKEEYVSINETALRVNEEWLRTPVDNRGLFVIEVLYHNACLKKAGQKIDLGKVLSKNLEVFPTENGDALKDSLGRLAGELRRDGELTSLFNELDQMKLLGYKEQLNSLIDMTENFVPLEQR